MTNFALTGVAGYIAPRHLRAIKATGSQLLAAHDPHDSVGVLDQYFPDAAYFQSAERFERFLSRRQVAGGDDACHFLSVCAPNWVHDHNVRLALRLDANALCEKPLVIHPHSLDDLETLESTSRGRVFVVLQLRVHPPLVELRDRLLSQSANGRSRVSVTYVTSRGPWYRYSWKGDPEKSGGLATNIGVHFFDLLIWLFGAVQRSEVHHRDEHRVAGALELDRADVTWFLSIDRADLPDRVDRTTQRTYRSITIDGEELEFSDGFTDLHTVVYQEALAGRGFGIHDARPSIELVHQIGSVDPLPGEAPPHPFLVRSKLRS